MCSRWRSISVVSCVHSALLCHCKLPESLKTVCPYEAYKTLAAKDCKDSVALNSESPSLEKGIFTAKIVWRRVLRLPSGRVCNRERAVLRQTSSQDFFIVRRADLRQTSWGGSSQSAVSGMWSPGPGPRECCHIWKLNGMLQKQEQVGFCNPTSAPGIQSIIFEVSSTYLEIFLKQHGPIWVENIFLIQLKLFRDHLLRT